MLSCAPCTSRAHAGGGGRSNHLIRPVLDLKTSRILGVLMGNDPFLEENRLLNAFNKGLQLRGPLGMAPGDAGRAGAHPHQLCVAARILNDLN